MTIIVTGKINSGKTSRLKKIYDQNQIGDGIISKKIMIDTDVYGFNGIRLSDNFEFPFMIHERYYFKNDSISYEDKNIESVYSIGPYKVLKSGIDFIDKTYMELLDKSISPLFFDEVGKLELSGKGYYTHIKEAVENKIDIFITIRDDLIIDFIEKLHIIDYQIVSR
ncbi:nucleoside-triphosphatase [Mycoplasmatota bacterium WC30]